MDLCNYCALCPCPNIRADLITAKTAFIARDGLPPRIRIIEDVALLAPICGSAPRLSQLLFRHPSSSHLIKRTMGIHPERQLPIFPKGNFPSWAAKNGLCTKPAAHAPRKVAYFAGCTASYLFPEVAQAAVAVLQSNGAAVWVPPQQCCGMPAFLEGDRKLTREMVRFNIEQLVQAVAEGFTITCSCPTCGFFFKNLLKDRAYYSQEYQSFQIKDKGQTAADHCADIHLSLRNTIYAKLLVDEWYFTFIPPMQRIRVAENTKDLGEWLRERHASGQGTPPLSGWDRLLYFTPCHQREQKIGQPYLELMASIAGHPVDSIDGNLYCCGMAGVMGFKKTFHEKSLEIGRPLMDKINQANPDRIITDCLSCRLQLHHATGREVLHPVELLQRTIEG